RLLKIDNINVNSDFFELGGHSLIAIRVIGELNKITDVKLPMSILFENSTIKKLAQVVEANSENFRITKSVLNKEIKWDSLVPIKPSGNKPPIYFVHGLGLNVMIFQPFSKHVDREQPVYGLQGLGLNSDTTEDFSMEELAKK